ncbi:MAG: ABC transporter ATP-binding protein, partial [Gammaproteobacteria bacterium]
NVSFTVGEGEIVGLVGESGSGKTMLSLALMGLLPETIRLTAGSIKIDEQELVESQTKKVERTPNQIAMVFQNPRNALNPTMRIGSQVARSLMLNQNLSRKESQMSALKYLSDVGLPDPEQISKKYPHQLSGGMCQRVVIAMALACRPRILIADEPTTGLDVTIQAQIFDLIRKVRDDTGCSVIFISHDLASVSELCEKVAVLYRGQLMEMTTKERIFENSVHPYSKLLVSSVSSAKQLKVIDRGSDYFSSGCRFAHRCPEVIESCSKIPEFLKLDAVHSVSCHVANNKSC